MSTSRVRFGAICYAWAGWFLVWLMFLDAVQPPWWGTALSVSALFCGFVIIGIAIPLRPPPEAEPLDGVEPADVLRADPPGRPGLAEHLRHTKHHR